MLNPYQQYKEQSLATLAPGELLVKLFEECMKQLLLGKRAIGAKDYEGANNALSKAQNIVVTLANSLDMKYSLSENLLNMYVYIAGRIQQANIKKDIAIIDECFPLVKDLRDSFDQAEKINRRNQVGGNAV